MGYVFHTPPTVSASGTRSLLLYSADGGVDYGAQGLSNGEKSDRAQNLWLSGGIITSRPAFAEIDETLPGVRHMAKEFCGAVLLHIGTVLYTFQNAAAVAILRGLPDQKSVPVEFAGKLYLYCGGHIYCVDRTLAAKEVYPYAPLYAEGRQSTSTSGNQVSDFKPNLLAPYVAVTFESERQVNGSYGYRFPADMDKTRHFDVYFEDRLVEEEELTVEETRFSFKTLKQTKENSVKLCYYSTASAAKSGDTLAKCTVGVAFGGGTVTGTRVFLAGNPDESGVYYRSALGEPLAFYEGEGGSLGESAGGITAFSKQSGDLLIFTDCSVSRMSYQYQAEGGGYFSTKAIHTGIGCDMPESVALAGNRTVFASSTHGVYLVDSVALFDRMNLVPLSHNITDSDGGKGFFAQSAAVRLAASACVYDRKYLLCMGDAAFVWDFGAADYAGSDPGKAEKKLVWTEFDGLDGGRFCVCGETLAAWKETESGCKLLVRAAEGRGSVPFVLDSGGMDLGLPHVRKALCRFSAECKLSRKTVIHLSFYADGERYFRAVVPVAPQKDGFARICVTLPHQVQNRFRFVLSGDAANVGFMNLRADYRTMKKQR